MGNSLPLPCACHHEANNDGEHGGGATAGARKRRRKKLAACRNATSSRAARARHVVVPVLDMPEDGGDNNGNKEEECPGCRVEPISGGDDGRRVRVKIVMKRKDIAELVARLEQRGATGTERERGSGGDARTVELGTDDLAGGRGGSVAMSPCRDAWRPRLSIIPENY